MSRRPPANPVAESLFGNGASPCFAAGAGFFVSCGPAGGSLPPLRVLARSGVSSAPPASPAGRHGTAATPAAASASVPAPRHYDLATVIFGFEAQAGVSNHLHWPNGSSGVTLGPGYDLKERTKAGVVTDLVAIGLKKTVAEAVADGCGLQADKAHAFATTNKALVNLTDAQQQALLRLTMPRYEKVVDDAVKVPLTPNQRTALVSLVYNIGSGSFATSSVLRHLNKGDFASACEAFRRGNKGKDAKGKLQVVRGLDQRRVREMEIFRTPEVPAAAPVPSSTTATATPMRTVP